MRTSLPFLPAFCLLLLANPGKADIVPLSANQIHANPFPSPSNIYSAPLGPGGIALEPVNDGLNSVNPWLDEVEWVVLGAAGIHVNYVFFNGAMNVFHTDFNVGPDLYIYVAYTQADDLGREVGGSAFVLANLTPFVAHYGLGVTEGPAQALPLPVPQLPVQNGGGGGGVGVGQRNRLVYDGTSITVISDSVPEPSALLLTLGGLGALLCRRILRPGLR